jgi:hypothetical protein
VFLRERLPSGSWRWSLSPALWFGFRAMWRWNARRLALKAPTPVEATVQPPFMAALATGAVRGFVSGTTGTGGGMLLAPIILVMGWSTPRQTVATTAVLRPDEFGRGVDWGPCRMGPDPQCIASLAGESDCWRYNRSLCWQPVLSDLWLRGMLALSLVISGLKLVWWGLPT